MHNHCRLLPPHWPRQWVAVAVGATFKSTEKNEIKYIAKSVYQTDIKFDLFACVRRVQDDDVFKNGFLMAH